MNSSEIKNYFKRLPIQNVGVYAADCLPLRIAPNTAIVVNTDPHTKAGTHWVAFFLDSNGCLEFFDSFGQPPSVPDHITFTRRNGWRFNFNSKHLQSPNSLVCGHYCLVYLMLRTCGITMRDFQAIFTSNENVNDSIVYNLFQNFFK